MSHFLLALQSLASPGVIIMCLAGVCLGIILGAIPGLSGSLAIIIMMPITFKMDASVAMAVMVSIWVGSCSGGFIGAVLLGIPGTPSSLATCYDGHAMTMNGEVTRALSIGTVSNFLGTVPSLIIAMIACPFIAKFAVKMSAWEYFALGLMAISMIVGMTKGNKLKGFLSAGLGLLLTQFGYSPMSATPRFMFGTRALSSGFNMLAVCIGCMAGSMIFQNYATIDEGNKFEFKGEIKPFYLPVKDFAANVVNVIRSFAYGLFIGFLPGLGGGLSNMVAYASAKNSSKTPEKFGRGCPDGIIAPEVANNASIGGALIPMLSLGIPGDTTTALLLGALAIHGIEAGPLLQKNHPDLVYTIYIIAIVAALVTLVVEALSIRVFPQILKSPCHYLYPAILLLCFIGVYANTHSIFAVGCALGFSVLGILMDYAGLPVTPMFLSYILGGMLEENLRKALSYAQGNWLSFFTRPVSCALLILTACFIIIPLIKEIKAGKVEDVEEE